MRYLGRSVCAVGLLALLVASSAQAQQKSAVSQVPGDAWVLVNVNNLQQSSTRLVELGNQFALGMMVPQMADPLGALQKKTNINAGLRKDGDMAVAMFDPAQAGGQPDRSFLMVIPITNYKEFLTNFQEARHEDNVDVVKIKGEEEPGYVADWGSHAALSPSKAMVTKQPGGLQLQGATAKILASKDVDITLYVNAKALSTKYLPELKNNRDNLLNEVDRAFQQGGGMPKYAPVIRAMLGQAISAAQTGMEDAQAVTVSLSFNKEGVGFSAIAEFKPESKIGKSVAAMKNTDGPLMGGLPQNDYLVYGGGKVDGQQMANLIDFLMDPAVQQLKGLDNEGKLFADGISAATSNMKSMKANVMGFILDPNPAQGGMIKSITVVDGNAAEMLSGQAKLIEAEQQLLKMMPPPRQTITYTPDAKTVDGVKFAKMQQNMAGGANTPEAMAVAQMMQQMFGGNGATSFTGAVDDKHLLTVMGDDEKLMQSAIASVKAGADPFADAANVKVTAAKLPQARMSVMYLNVNKAVQAGTEIAANMGGPRVKLELPANLPPIGATISAEGSALRMDAYIPSQIMTSITNAVMQMQMKMRGGGAGRPGDL